MCTQCLELRGPLDFHLVTFLCGWDNHARIVEPATMEHAMATILSGPFLPFSIALIFFGVIIPMF